MDDKQTGIRVTPAVMGILLTVLIQTASFIYVFAQLESRVSVTERIIAERTKAVDAVDVIQNDLKHIRREIDNLSDKMEND